MDCKVRQCANRADPQWHVQKQGFKPTICSDWGLGATALPIFFSPPQKNVDSGGSRKNIWGGGGPSSFGRQQRL